jgi:hypothetical protein
MKYRVIDFAGRWYTEKGFTSYVHYDAIKFSTLDEAKSVAKLHNAKVEYV